MKETKLIVRFAAGTAAVVIAYFSGSLLYPKVQGQNIAEPPKIILASGEEAGSAGDTVKFSKADAKNTALSVWTAEPPAINEFLSKFRCSGCSKNCLLIAPMCINGKTKNEQAIEIYQELYPEMEL